MSPSHSTNPNSGNPPGLPMTLPKFLLVAGWLAFSSAHAGSPPTGGEFTLRKSTIDAGGGASEGGAYSLVCTIGQPDTQFMQGAEFTLHGGFLTPFGPSDFLFIDSFETKFVP